LSQEFEFLCGKVGRRRLAVRGTDGRQGDALSTFLMWSEIPGRRMSGFADTLSNARCVNRNITSSAETLDLPGKLIAYPRCKTVFRDIAAVFSIF